MGIPKLSKDETLALYKRHAEAQAARAEAAETSLADMRRALERAVWLAEHLHAMIPRDLWRATGGDDGQGHYEGDYHAEQVAAELTGLRALAAAGPAPEETEDEQIARIIRERDAADTGERITLAELIEEHLASPPSPAPEEGNSVSGEYVLDSTFGEQDGLLCFCPIERDEHGEVTAILTGLNYLSSSPPDGSVFVGVIHAEGQEACDAWCADNQPIIDRLVAERDAAVPSREPGGEV